MVNGGEAVGIVLAAGAGTRFGGPKVLAAEGDWLHSAVQALADGGCGSVIVVLGAAVVAVPSPARAVVAEDWADGMSASLRAGLTAAGDGEAQAAVLHLVDIPDVGAEVVHRVLTAMRDAALRAGAGPLPGCARPSGGDIARALAGAAGDACPATGAPAITCAAATSSPSNVAIWPAVPTSTSPSGSRVYSRPSAATASRSERSSATDASMRVRENSLMSSPSTICHCPPTDRHGNEHTRPSSTP